MPSTATITAFYTFSSGTQIKSSEHNTNFSNFRGHLIAIDPNTATAAATLTYDLGATDKYWRAAYVGQVTANTVTATTIQATSLTATHLVATTATITNLTATAASITTLVATSINATTIVATSLNATTIVGTTIAATTLQPTNIVQATTTGIGVSSLINLTSGQIQFPAAQSASADANTLDDYEEGTWTAAFSSGGGSVTIDSTKDTGAYTKIGRMVAITGFFNVSSVSSPTGSLQITGLPFTVGNLSEVAGSAAFCVRGTGFAAGATTALHAYVNESGTNIVVERFSAGGAVDLASTTQAGSSLFISGIYFI